MWCFSCESKGWLETANLVPECLNTKSLPEGVYIISGIRIYQLKGACFRACDPLASFILQSNSLMLFIRDPAGIGDLADAYIFLKPPDFQGLSVSMLF